MYLSDAKIKKTKPSNSEIRLSDGEGLRLLIKPSGKSHWQFRFRFAGREQLMNFGTYPELSLAEAREARVRARRLLQQGQNPIIVKRTEQRQRVMGAENSFAAVAREWHGQREGLWSVKYSKSLMSNLERNAFPDLGVRPIADINTLELLDTVRKVERRGAIELAHRLLETCGQIFRYAVITGRVKYNITADLKGVLKTRKVEHHAYLKAHELPDFLRKVEGYQGDILTKLALKLMLLTFVRTGELINAQWSEFNLAKAQWIIPAERMKMGEQHIVPLSRQAIGILAELRRHTGTRSHLFPGRNNPHKPMSNNTLLFASYRMGYHGRMTIHGLRATASTILNEMHFPADVIERQLAHGERNEIRRAYNHAQYLPQRADMMQRWADYLEELTEKGHVVSISEALVA